MSRVQIKNKIREIGKIKIAIVLALFAVAVVAGFFEFSFPKTVKAGTTFTSTQSGAFNLGTTWGGACASNCVAGTNFPGTSDTAVISNGTTVTLDSSRTVGALTINSGGTFDTSPDSGAHSYNFAVNNYFSNSGTFNAEAGLMYFYGNFTNSGTWVTGTGTVTIGNATSYTKNLITGGAVFNNVAITTFIFDDDIHINGNLTIGDTVSTSGTVNIYLKGNFSATGGSRYFPYSGSTINLIFNGSTNQTISNIENFAANITVNKTGGSLLLSSDLSTTGNITINAENTLDTSPDGGTHNYSLAVVNATFTNSGTFNAESGSHYFYSNFTNSGTFNAGTSTIALGNPTSAGQLITTGGAVFNNATITTPKLMDDIHINKNLTVTDNITTSGTVNIYVGGNFSATGGSRYFPYTGTINLIFNGSGNQTLSNVESFYASITVNKTGGTLSLSSALGISGTTGTVTINAGNTFNLAGNNFSSSASFTNNGTLMLAGSETFSSGTLTFGTGSAVVYTATSGTQNVKNWSYKNLMISGVGGTFVMPSGASVGTLILGAGTTTKITHSTTTTVTNLVSLGNAQSLATLTSDNTTAGTLAVSGGAKIVANYLNLSYNTASPSNALYYGAWSTVGSGVTNWNSGGIIGQNSTSGTFVSSIINLGKYSSFGNLSYNVTNQTGTSVSVKFRTSANADMSGATDWANCSAVSSGSAISTDSCATAGQQYAQYQAVLSSPNTTVTPSLDDVSIQYNAYPTTASLTSSMYDSGDPTNEIAFLSWDQTTPSGTTVTLSLRTASSSSGLSSANWSPLTNGNPVTCTLSSGTVTCPLSAIPTEMQDATGDQWFQYKATLTSEGANTPTVTNITIKYVVNQPPQFDATYGTNGVIVSQISDKNDAHFGKVKIQYKPYDPDTLSGSPANQGYVTPSFQYYSGSTWVNIPSQYLDSGNLNRVAVGQAPSNDHVYTAYWDAQSELPSNYSATMQVQVTADDGELANHIGTAQGAQFALDTKVPAITTATLDAAAGALTISVSDNSNISYRLSTTALPTSITSGPAWTDVGAVSLSGTLPITVSTTTPTVYFQARDPFGNLTSKTIIAPTIPFNFNLKDTSNLLSGDFREFLSWQVYTNETGSTFSHYEIDRASGSSSSTAPSTAYSVIGTVSNVSTNFYNDPPTTAPTIVTGTMYYYKVRIVDTDGDSSAYSGVLSDMPDGTGGTDVTPPRIISVSVSPIEATWVDVTWTTDKAANSTVNYSLHVIGKSPTYNLTATSNSYALSHTVVVSGLTPLATYDFKVTSSDIANNQTTDDNNGQGYQFTTVAGPVISDTTTESVTDTTAIIEWNTTTSSNSHVIWATDIASLRSCENSASIGTCGNFENLNSPNDSGGSIIDTTSPSLGMVFPYFTHVFGDIIGDASPSDSGSNNAPVTISSVNSISDINVNNGTSLASVGLPTTVGVALSDLTAPSVIVTWDGGSPAYDGSTAGTYVFTGALTLPDGVTNPNSLTASVNVIVAAASSSGQSQQGAQDIGSDTLVAVASNSGLYQHKVVITGLSKQTTYYFYVKSTDADGNFSIDDNSGNYYSFKTTFDTTPPVISVIATPLITSSTAVISWQTDKLANGMIQYGTKSGAYTHSTPTDVLYTVSHLETLHNLTESTKYYYIISSTDVNGNSSTSGEQAFTTAASDATLIAQALAGQPGASCGGGGVSVRIDKTPPVISNVSAASNQPFGITISFNTDKPTTGYVSYGKDTNYGDTVADLQSNTSHSLKINHLEMGTLYHLLPGAEDGSGNIGNSTDITATTEFVSESLKNLVTLKNASTFQNQLEDLISSVMPSLVPPLVANVKISNITENSATVNWQTSVPAYGGVDYATQDSYSVTSDKPYDQNSSQTDSKTTDHSLVLSGLLPSTSYHIRASGYSLPGVVGYSNDTTFATKALITTTEIGKIGNTDFQVQWITSQKTSSVIEYTDPATGQIKQVNDSALVQNHVVNVANVNPDTTYSVRTFGYDANNNIIEGGALKVRTTKDVTPPVISNIKINSAMLPGNSNFLQTVVSWLTDKPASSQVYYDQGVSINSTLKNHVEDQGLTIGHVLIVPSLMPSTVYRFKVISTDASGNTAQSPIKTVLTPQSAENIIDVIIKNLQESFGFLQKL